MSKKKSRRMRKRNLRIRRTLPPGTAPGTVISREGASRPDVKVIAYGPDELLEKPIADLKDLATLASKYPVLWVDVAGLGDAAAIVQIGEVFGLHALALEDVANVHQRPKVEEYDDHLFIVARMMELTEGLKSDQLSLFLGKNFVVTFQELPGDCFDPVRERLRKSRGRIRKAGPDYLMYSLLDAVVDAYFPVVDHLGERLEQLDEEIERRQSRRIAHTLHELRGDLMILRRSIRPLRDALVMLMPDPNSLISDETQFYLRDCFDHTVQLLELLDSHRDVCTDLRDYMLSSISNRMNEIMKVLTIISTIFIPLSFIAGVYGMNFNTELPANMPELNWHYGYPLVLLLMLLVACGLMVYFWVRGWLTGA